MIIIYNGREIDTTKDMRTITDLDELRDYLNVMFEMMSRTHPKYPEYGYTYKDGEIVEVKRTL